MLARTMANGIAPTPRFVIFDAAAMCDEISPVTIYGVKTVQRMAWEIREHGQTSQGETWKGKNENREHLPGTS